MMNQYESMLNLTFEIEGLLSLLQRRDDEGVNEVKSLLETKVKALYQGILGSEATVVSEAPEALEAPEVQELPELHEVPAAPELPEITVVDEPVIDTPVVSETVIEDTAPVTSPVVEAPSEVSLPVFTINDKFRFRRELFANSEADFVDTLNVLSAMSSYEEAEDYLYNDLCWDSESDEVADFMTIIKDYFDKR